MQSYKTFFNTILKKLTHKFSFNSEYLNPITINSENRIFLEECNNFKFKEK